MNVRWLFGRGRLVAVVMVIAAGLVMSVSGPAAYAVDRTGDAGTADHVLFSLIGQRGGSQICLFQGSQFVPVQHTNNPWFEARPVGSTSGADWVHQSLLPDLCVLGVLGQEYRYVEETCPPFCGGPISHWYSSIVRFTGPGSSEYDDLRCMGGYDPTSFVGFYRCSFPATTTGVIAAGIAGQDIIVAGNGPQTTSGALGVASLPYAGADSLYHNGQNSCGGNDFTPTGGGYDLFVGPLNHYFGSRLPSDVSSLAAGELLIVCDAPQSPGFFGISAIATAFPAALPARPYDYWSVVGGGFQISWFSSDDGGSMRYFTSAFGQAFGWYGAATVGSTVAPDAPAGPALPTGCFQFSVAASPTVMYAGVTDHVVISKNVPGDPVLAEIAVRFRNEDAWTVVYSTLPGGVAPGPAWPSNYFGIIPPGVTTYAANMQLRCTLSAGGVSYAPPSDPAVPVGTIGSPGNPVWGGVSSEGGPCTRVYVIWPPSLTNYSVGDLAQFWEGMSGVTSGLATLSIATFDPLSAAVFDPSAASWTVVSEWTSSAPHPLVSGQFATAFAGNAAQFHFKCVDVNGTTISGTLDPGVGFDAPPPTAAADCYGSINIGLSPSSWVPAALRGAGCVASTMFVPSPADVDAVKAAGLELQGHAPVSYVVEVSAQVQNLLSGTPALIAAHSNDCLTILGGMSAAHVLAQSVCPGTLVSSGASAGDLGTFRTVETGIFWISFGWLLWGMSRKLLK